MVEKGPNQLPEEISTPVATPTPEVEESFIDFYSIEFVLGLVALVVISILIALLKRDRIL